MKFFKKTQGTLKRAAGVNMIKDQASFIKKMATGVFVPRKSDRRDKFEDLGGMGVSEQQVKDAMKAFKRLTILFLVFAVFVVIYLVYSFIAGNYLTGIISIALLAVCLAQAFKYHFWYFQCVKCKLGCTPKEWFEFLISQIVSGKNNKKQ